jgi:hypothetical protein
LNIRIRNYEVVHSSRLASEAGEIMRGLTSAPLLVTLAVALLAPHAVNTQVASPQERNVPTPAVSPVDGLVPAPAAFEVALFQAGMPGGVASVQGGSDKPEQAVRLHGITLPETLDSITTADPRYVWRVKKGVVDLEPSQGVPALLRTHIKNYDSRDLTDALSAVTVLSASLEVERAASRIGLVHNILVGSLGSVGPLPLPRKKPLRVRLQDVTLLEAFNALVGASKHGVWSYREIHCGKTAMFDVIVAE